MGAHHVLFKDRRDAGIQLSDKLAFLRGKQATVLGLARGGIIVASAIASALKMPVDVLVVKKLSSPTNSEFAIGAVAPDTVSVVHWKDAHRAGLDEDTVRHNIEQLSFEIVVRTRAYRRSKSPIVIKEKTVVLVDDGAATGATMEAAVLWARKKKANRIIVAIPVISQDAANNIRPEVEALITLGEVENFGSVGEFYTEFPQVTDEEVIQSLHI